MAPKITSDEYGKVVLATLIPGATSLIGWAVVMKDKSFLDEWQAAADESAFFPRDMRVTAAIDALTLLPLGPASYIVYKAGGFDAADTRAALTAYGAMIAAFAAIIPIMKQRNEKLVVCRVNDNCARLWRRWPAQRD